MTNDKFYGILILLHMMRKNKEKEKKHPCV